METRRLLEIRRSFLCVASASSSTAVGPQAQLGAAEQTDFSIERISRLCGYDEPSSFSNFFKREVGTNPKAYRAADAKKS